MNNPSYNPNYYSIDDILVTQERVPCEAAVDMPRLGFLDTSEKSNDLKEGQELELPLWIFLGEEDRNLLFKPTIPDIYTPSYREIYKADATYVELGSLNKYYYEFGMYLAQLVDNSDVLEMLSDTCRERLISIKDMCNNVSDENMTDNKKLEFLEKMLYDAGVRKNRLFSDWLQEKSVNIKSTELVTNHRKRKRDVMENEDTSSQA